MGVGEGHRTLEGWVLREESEGQGLRALWSGVQATAGRAAGSSWAGGFSRVEVGGLGQRRLFVRLHKLSRRRAGHEAQNDSGASRVPESRQLHSGALACCPSPQEARLC